MIKTKKTPESKMSQKFNALSLNSIWSMQDCVRGKVIFNTQQEGNRMFMKRGIGCFISGIVLSWAFFAQAGEMPKPEAAAVWKFITKESSFTDWAFWPGNHESQASHSYVPDTPKYKTYANKQALESTKPPLNNGAMVVKYNLSPADEIKAITIMYKVKGYNPSAGDWFWVQYDPNGEVQEAGKPEKCIACHSSRADNDYILAHEFDN